MSTQAERLQLGVIDNQYPAWVSKLVPHLDELGYSHYWTTERHSSFQSGSPIVMTAIAAGLSRRMRVGTAGILLNYYSPVKVVEDFRLLQLMHGGRLDLGVSGGIVPVGLESALLDGRPPDPLDRFADRLRALVRLVRRAEPRDGEVAGADLGPGSEGVPDLWLCGSSERSAALAAELGLCFAFHDAAAHRGPASAPKAPELQEYDGLAILRTYVKGFQAHPGLPRPRFSVACYGICAESDELAEELWRTRPGKRPGTGEPLPAAFCGTPDRCHAQLQGIRERYGTNEIAVQSFAESFRAVMNSYALLADRCGLN